MREIKFRVWDKTRKNIFQVTSIDFVLEKVEIWVSGIATFLSFNEIELMQYTGLKDKNDVEIYEGDVVLIESEFLGNWTRSEVTWGGPNYPAFDIPKFDSDVMNGFSAIAYTDYGETLKVIGNIHDNPELLEVAK